MSSEMERLKEENLALAEKLRLANGKVGVLEEEVRTAVGNLLSNSRNGGVTADALLGELTSDKIAAAPVVQKIVDRIGMIEDRLAKLEAFQSKLMEKKKIRKIFEED